MTANPCRPPKCVDRTALRTIQACPPYLPRKFISYGEACTKSTSSKACFFRIQPICMCNQAHEPQLDSPDASNYRFQRLHLSE